MRSMSLLVLAVVVAGSSPDHSAKPVDNKPVVVKAVGVTSWSPATITIKAGDAVTFKNSSSTLHNVQFDRLEVGATKNVAPFASTTESVTFTKAGTYAFHCGIHPAMQGQVIVTEKADPVLQYPTNYVRQTDTGNFLLGPSSKDAGFDLNTEPATLRDISTRCIRAFPLLENFRVQRVWAALRVMTPDGFPVYQQSSSHPGAFSFACHSGVTLAANHALEVSKWVTQGAIPGRYQAFHPGRFDVQANSANR